MFRKLFSKKVDIKRDSEIEIGPDLELSPEDREALYNSAVKEVVTLRLQSLINKQLTYLIQTDTEVNRQLKAAEIFLRGTSCMQTTRSEIEKKFPLLKIKQTGNGTYAASLPTPDLTVISAVLANQYLKEFPIE